MSAQQLAGLVDMAEALADLEFATEAASGAAGILSFLEVAGGFDFDLPPEKAIAYFERKGLRPTFSYADMIGETHDQAFTVAKMMDVDLLGQVKASLDSALANGTPFREWANDLMPTLQKAGWWGRKKVLDPATGAVLQAELGSPWRLETVFRTNLQQAYSAGKWQEIEAQAEVAPYLMYDAVDDFRTRPSHKARDGTVLRWDDPWWRRNCPPLGYNCRCGVIQLSADDLRSIGRRPSRNPPTLDDVPWRNPRTGEESSWPEGVDPGFGRKPATGSIDPLRTLLDEKIGVTYDQVLRAAAEQSTSMQARVSAVNGSIRQAAGQIKASAAAAALLRESKSRAGAAQAQISAQLQLDEALKLDDFMRRAVEELSLDPAWRALPATERLRDAKRRARELERGA